MTMTVSYEIILTIINLTDNSKATFNKFFKHDLEETDDKLYNNHHLISKHAKMYALFSKEISDYCKENQITRNNIDIDEFNIISHTSRIDVYFESDEEDNTNLSLQPNIKCYVYPKYEKLAAPVLTGEAYDDTTIIWKWSNDEYSHYLVTETIDVSDPEEKEKIIADIPIGTDTFVETNLKADTRYTRRLIRYNAVQTSDASYPVTVQTATAPIDKSLEEYEIEKNYDYTSDDSDREKIDENLEAFHSGVGDFNDLKVYKQMDADFYQKFKTYIQLRGERTQREKHYDSVGFNYKVCLEGKETVEEQKGEVTFDIEVFPREHITIKDYMYATQPVKFYARMQCDVLLKKENTSTSLSPCSLKEPKWERTKKQVENAKATTNPAKFKYNNPHIILCIDVTNSLKTTLNGIDNLKSAIKEHVLNTINAKAKEHNTTVTYSVVKFGNSAKVIDKDVDYETATNTINNLNNNEVGGTPTNWQAGLKAAATCVNSKKDNILFFFSDGGCNACDSIRPEASTGAWWYYPGDEHQYPNYGQTFKDAKGKPHDVAKFNASKGWPTNGLLSTISAVNGCVYSAVLVKTINGYNEGSRTFPGDYIKKCCDIITNNDSKSEFSWNDKDLKSLTDGMDSFINKITVESNASISWTDPKTGKKRTDTTKDTSKTWYVDPVTGELTDKATHTEDSGWKFDGWINSSQNADLDIEYAVDDCRWCHVVIPPMDEDPWEIEINDTITPIIYARNEQRAIVPSDYMIEDRNFDPNSGKNIRQEAIKICGTDIEHLIKHEAERSRLWNEGYNSYVKARTADEKKQGYLIIRGLFIKDTYSYNDEENVPDVNFADDKLTDGYEGTLNIYGDINKLGTNDYGDDVYAVGSDKYVWVSGYTDAIIYDGERVETIELNASHAEPQDKQTEVLISKDLSYNNLLWNRKNRYIGYTGNNSTLKHVVDVMQKDKDIYITENNILSDVLQKEGDWCLFVPPGTNISDPDRLIRGVALPIIRYLNYDFIAHNDEDYKSPILNYRFALEDPDAWTAYKEVLPDCDPFSTYRNIVFIHIYYARNIYIQDEHDLSSGKSVVYIASFGENNIANTSSPFYPDSVNTHYLGQTYFRDEMIDDVFWFQAKEMIETRNYYDEKPNPGMQSFYGNVNGRYYSDNKSGKRDLRVVTPQFNIPTTVDAKNIKIYIMITEFYPDTALVAYKWEHPLDGQDSITNVNGDYVTFMSDSLTYKDEIYNDLIQTISTEGIELFNNKTTEHRFELDKPLTKYTYDKYLIEIYTDNADVLVLSYPRQIFFDENDKAQFGAAFKGVVNATTKWSPIIHNGYYYLNQHQYYAYSEFNVDADFEELSTENYKTINGYLTIDVTLCRKAPDPVHYKIVKDTRAELMQDENNFIWVNNKGLTLKPFIDGEYYKEYHIAEYVSPVIMFGNTLTSAGRLKLDYSFDDGFKDLQLYIRSYKLEEGVWSDWTPFTNDTAPVTANCPLSCAYQIKCTLAASVVNQPKTIEDYLCCYLDWKDDQDLNACYNITTVTDHLQPGPYFDSDGTFVSKILDYGCESDVYFDIFDSNINAKCFLYVASSNKKNDLLIENIKWTQSNQGITVKGRYVRYKIVVPPNEKLYWLHKIVNTKESTVFLPYIKQISMEGDYTPSDKYDSFQDIESFEIATDGKEHRIYPSIYDLISTDIKTKGYEDNEIQYVRLNCTNTNINIKYDSANVNNEYPSVKTLSSPIYATADYEIDINTKHTPYILANFDTVKEMDIVHIRKGTPQQYSPITVEDSSGVAYEQIFDVDPNTLVKEEEIVISTEDDRHFVKLSRNDFDIRTLKILLNNTTEEINDYTIINNIITFDKLLNINDVIKVSYNILNSFYAEIDNDNNTTDITIYSNADSELAKKNELANIKPITNSSKFTECNLAQIYSNGIKEYHTTKYITDDSDWKYDANLPAIYMPENKDGYSIIINRMTPSSIYSLTTVAKSFDYDDDVIGIVACYQKDATGTYHTLSYLVSLGTKSESLFNNSNVALVLDYNTENQRVLAYKNVNHDSYRTWSDLQNGIEFYINKTDNTLVCSFSTWDKPGENNTNTAIAYNLDLNKNTSIFSNECYYGFGVKSQKNTYFESPTYSGNITQNITVKEQIQALRHKYKIYFETNKINNKFIAHDLSLNPVYRTDYKGFIYLTDEHNEPYKINIYCNPKYIKCGGYDKIDISVECLDYLGNPLISKDIYIDCDYGILNFDNTDAKHLTDMNGVVHVLYESAISPCTDTFTARTETSDGKVIESSVEIVNEEK